MGGPFGANGRIEKYLENFSLKPHKMRENTLRHGRRQDDSIKIDFKVSVWTVATGIWWLRSDTTGILF
jgi:hypothetical protein